VRSRCGATAISAPSSPSRERSAQREREGGREGGREGEREKEGRTDGRTDGRTEASRYGNVIWGLCPLVYYCGNNGRHVMTSLSYNHVRNPRGSSGIRRRRRRRRHRRRCIPGSPLRSVSSVSPRRCPAFGYTGTTVTRSTVPLP